MCANSIIPSDDRPYFWSNCDGGGLQWFVGDVEIEIPNPDPYPFWNARMRYAWAWKPEHAPSRVWVKNAKVLSPSRTLQSGWKGLEKMGMCSLPGPVFLVSSATAEVLKRFNLGTCLLQRMPIWSKKDKAQLPIDCYFFHIGNQREVLVPLKADRFSYNTNGFYGQVFYTGGARDNLIAVKRDPNPGPDIWLDPIWSHGFFMSPRLAEALRAVHLEHCWDLHACRWATKEECANVVGPHTSFLYTQEGYLVAQADAKVKKKSLF